MNEWTIKDKDTGDVWHKDSRHECEEAVQEFGDVKDLEIIPPDSDASTEDTTDNQAPPAEAAAEVVTPEENQTTAKDVIETESKEPEVVEPSDLSKDPIGFLQTVNSEFVNHIKGKPAISKQGFRFIQREFEISTESEVVKWSDDPLGCVVWAKAELPGGYSAEAHGEGWQFESKVDDNEFVRYADTRAKNRAISDLTSAGALAVSELQE